MIDCTVCRGNKNHGKKIPYPGYIAGKSPPGFPSQIAFCDQCGTGSAYPYIPEEFLHEHYTQEASPWGDLGKMMGPRDFPIHYALGAARWKLISPYVIDKKALTVLDVGAGNGAFGFSVLNESRMAKYIAQDVDQNILKRLRELWPESKIKLQTVSEFSEIKDRADILVFSHIIEHIQNPGTFIEKCLEKVGPGAIIYAEVPFDDFKFKPTVFPHVKFFNADGFKKLFENFGIESLQCTSWGRPRVLKERKSDFLIQKLENAVMKFRNPLPSAIVFNSMDFLYGASRKNSKGPWLRFVGRLP